MPQKVYVVMPQSSRASKSEDYVRPTNGKFFLDNRAIHTRKLEFRGPNSRTKSSMVVVELKFSSSISESDPQEQPCLIIGQLEHLKDADFADIRKKLKPRVEEKVTVSCHHIQHA